MPQPVPQPAVDVRGLAKRYGATTAVDDLSMTVDRGSITAIIGPNGAGKTTTIEMCEGYRRPDAGLVRVLGLDPIRDARALRPRIGVMLQDGGGYPGARCSELLAHAAALHANPVAVATLAERLGLGELGRTPYRRMSGGQRQRLHLALALVGRPELVFLDEPTAGMDLHARRETWRLIGDLHAAGVTVVLTTHLLDEAERLANRVLIVDRGRVLADGSPAELASYAADRILTFHGPAGMNLRSLSAALPCDAVVVEPVPGLYRIEGEISPQLLATVTAWCASHGVMPDRIATGQRSLEDVFIDLTGREPTGD